RRPHQLEMQPALLRPLGELPGRPRALAPFHPFLLIGVFMHDESRPPVTSGARRGCGYRQPGRAYFAVPLAPGGRPVEEFLIDPPVVIEDAARLGLTSVGMGVFERDGVTHVVDIVGREHYPTVAEFVDEARRLGVSRRAPRTIDYAQITAQSRLLLAHTHLTSRTQPSSPPTRSAPAMCKSSPSSSLGSFRASLANSRSSACCKCHSHCCSSTSGQRPSIACNMPPWASQTILRGSPGSEPRKAAQLAGCALEKASAR